MALNVDLDMRVDPGSEVSMSVEDGDEVSFGVAEAIVVKDHATLDNRDLPNQHPISAITGLAEALAESGKIDTVKVNGTALPVVNKAVDVPVPTTTSQLTNNSGFITEDEVPNELFIVVFSVTSIDPLAVATDTTAYEVAEAVMSGKALYAVLFAGASMANLTPTTLVQDNDDVLVKFVFNEQSNSALGIKYFEISMLNDNAPSVLNIKTKPFLTEITSSNVTTALGYTPYSDTNPNGYITASQVPVTSVNGRTGAVTGLAEASALSNYLNLDTGGTIKSTVDFQIGNGSQSTGSPSIRFNALVNDVTKTWGIKMSNGELSFSYDAMARVKLLNDGSITAKTQATTDNSTKVATTAFVKSVLPTVPTNVSSFTNDAGYLVASDLTEATDADVIAIVV